MNNNFSNLKSIVILGLIAWIILLRGCDRDTVAVPFGEGREIKIHTIVDTTHKYVTHIDTLQFIDSVLRYVYINISEPEIMPETGLKEYSEVFSDSLIEGELKSIVDGTLIKQSFTYVPKFPKYILKTDSIFTTIEKTITKTINKRELYLGFEIGGSLTKFNISPMISLKDKKHNLYSFRYGMIDQTFNIGLHKQIKFK